MKPSARRFVQHLASIAIVLPMLLVPDSQISFGSRAVMVGVAVLAAVALSARRLRDANLLISPLDYGLLPYVLLTGLTVLFAPSPRRSLESWLWLIAIQLPLAYAALYLFRRRWPERTIYRALLVGVGYLYVLAVEFTLNYLAQWLVDRADGVAAPGFRLFGILNHPNIFGMVIAVSTPCMVGYLFLSMRGIERTAVVLWLAGAALALFGTGSRTSLIATIIGLSVAFALSLFAHPRQPLVRFRAWAMGHRRQAAGLTLAGTVVLVMALGVAIYLQFGRPLQDDGGGRLDFFKSAVTLFVAHPLVGAGPGGFVRNQVQTHSVPPWVPWPHAHDMFLNTAAESGIVGLAGFLALLLVAGWICVAVWRRRPSMRPLIAGPIGGLLAFCITGLLDTPINQFGPFFLAIILLAYIAAMLPPPGEIQWPRMRLVVVAVWAVVLLLVLVVIPYSAQWDSAQPGSGPDSVQTLEARARRLDSVITFDGYDPLITLQSAYTWAALASSDSRAEALPTAIARLERAIQLDPDLAVHYLNLSVLYMQAQRPVDAVRAAQQAADRAPGDGIGWLNLGLALEKTGQEPEAQAAYVEALRHDSWWSAAGFWQTTPARQAAQTHYLALADRSRYYDLLSEGDAARQSGQKGDAIRAYEEALKVVPGPVATAYVQGMIALASGDLASARAHLLRVTTMDIVEIPDQLAFADAWLCLGDLARDQGDKDGMLRDYGKAYRFLTARGLGGFGTKNSPVYAIIGYQRYGVISDYLPGVVMLDISPDVAARFRALAESLEASGNAKDASDVYRHILQSNPEDTQAKAALAQLRP